MCSSDLNLSGFIPSTVMSPLVTAAATKYVPASILSAGISYIVPFKLFTPSIIISSDPAPLIFAPIELSISARSIISGSLATTPAFVLAVTYTSVANVVFIFASIPIFALIFSYIFIGEKILLSTLVTSFIVIIGLAIRDAGVCRRLARTPRVPLAPEGRGRVCEGGTGRK